jgi:hypothetical protein
MVPRFTLEAGAQTGSPRPWPLEPSRASDLVAIGVQTVDLAQTHAPVPLGELKTDRPDPQDRVPTPDGWRVPRNRARALVVARDLFDVTVGTEDLGPLKVLSSAHGRLRALRLQWPEETQEPAWSAQREMFLDIFTRLPADLELHIISEGLALRSLSALLTECPNPERVHIHELHLHSTPTQLYLPMTMWARDGALTLRTEAGTPVLLLPRSFRGDGQVDAKLNRLQVQGTGAAPARLGQCLPELCVRRSALTFEGGDVVASRSAALVGAETIARNVQELKCSRREVVIRLSQQLGVPVHVVEPQPDFHLDLGFTFLDDRVVAVADPAEGIRLAGPGLQAAVRVTQEKQLAERYNRAAQGLLDQGYQVVRLPNLAGLGLHTPYYTYNNVLMEQYGAVRRVYMPSYDHPALDAAARSVYREHGFTVVDIPAARHSTRLWGALRCATGELWVSEA